MTYLHKSLGRRTILRGLGASVALPLLDAMPATAATKPAQRFLAFYVPNGMAMEYWTPKGEGREFELSPILEPLAPFRNQMLVLSGLKANWNYIHAGASGSFLTGTVRGGRNEVEIIADVSMDQLLARHFAAETQVASLEMAIDPPANAGACTGNLSCVYTHTLCWRSATQPLPMEWNPRAVFEKLFGDTGSTERAAREARLRQHKSILDSVNVKLASLKRDLAAGDQRRLDEYTEAIRDVERRIERAESQRAVELPAMEQPQGAPPVLNGRGHVTFAVVGIRRGSAVATAAAAPSLPRFIAFPTRRGYSRLHCTPRATTWLAPGPCLNCSPSLPRTACGWCSPPRWRHASVRRCRPRRC